MVQFSLQIFEFLNFSGVDESSLDSSVNVSYFASCVSSHRKILPIRPICESTDPDSNTLLSDRIPPTLLGLEEARRQLAPGSIHLWPGLIRSETIAPSHPPFELHRFSLAELSTTVTCTTRQIVFGLMAVGAKREREREGEGHELSPRCNDRARNKSLTVAPNCDAFDTFSQTFFFLFFFSFLLFLPSIHRRFAG